MVGDIITSVERKNENVESIVTVQRANTKGEATTLSLPVRGKVRGTIGWTGKQVAFEAGLVASYPWAYFSSKEAFEQTSYYSKVIFNTLIGIFLDLPKIVTTPAKQGGIVAMANVAAPQVSGGILTFLCLILSLSFLIAITSLVPFPGFDGWQAIMYLAEAITKKSAPIFIQQSVARAGLAVMSVLTVYLIGKDVFDYVVVKLF